MALKENKLLRNAKSCSHFQILTIDEYRKLYKANYFTQTSDQLQAQRKQYSWLSALLSIKSVQVAIRAATVSATLELEEQDLEEHRVSLEKGLDKDLVVDRAEALVDRAQVFEVDPTEALEVDPAEDLEEDLAEVSEEDLGKGLADLDKDLEVDLAKDLEAELAVMVSEAEAEVDLVEVLEKHMEDNKSMETLDNLPTLTSCCHI
ncbi:uncharacterized protein [Watersipora subatra]|uniref:uncharacterized protein n=1 Tax=Watersipora subatra TaxID=2589382 RepID=UPI00355C172D